MKITSEQFFQYLRSALNHLYDPYFLRKSPLVRVFGLGDQPDSVSALQRILNDAIARLETRAGESPAALRRSYELILYRYVQQFGQEEIAAQMGVSVRHLRREQNAAVYELAATLWEQYQLGARPFEVANLDMDEAAASAAEAAAAEAAGAETAGADTAGTEAAGAETSAEMRADPAAASDPGLDEDLRWLKSLPLTEPANLALVLEAVLDLSRPLASRYGVELRVNSGERLPGLAIQQVALRQLLLNVLSVTICQMPGSVLEITGQAGPEGVKISLSSTRRSAHPAAERRPLTADEQASLRIAARMAELYGGSLAYFLEGDPCGALISLPVFPLRVVLVVDDNLDFQQLVERTLTGTRYKAAGERSPQQAVETAAALAPDFILLDVMMPLVDGWEVLGRLRGHPATARIPVIICTILPQEELARSLGAADFLRKPVTPQRILAALDRQRALLEQESR